MEEELKNFIKVWILAAAGLSYCYYVASKIPKGVLRLLSVLPGFYLFIFPPLSLTSLLLNGVTSYFLVWLANFKLLLFCFDQPPFSPFPPNLFHFICLACLPIQSKQNPSKENSYIPKKSSQNLVSPKSIELAMKALLFVLLFIFSKYRHLFHPHVILAFYCLYMYFILKTVIDISGTLIQAIFGFEIEQQFNKPYLSTSLQDFWGRRWNLMVTNILRSTVYIPVRQCLSRIIARQWASLLAMFATFIVSGLMHEVNYFYLTRSTPTWGMTWFFILHGVCVVAEVAVKKAVKDRWRLHPVVSRLLTLGFVFVTAAWLFFPQLTGIKFDERAVRECSIFVDFMKHKLRNHLLLIS